MSLSQIIEKRYSNQIKNIINEKNQIIKSKLIGALVADVVNDIGKRCISAISKLIKCCRQKIKKDYLDYINGKQIKIEFRGRKNHTELYPNLINDIEKIIENHIVVSEHFRENETIVNLTPATIITILVNKYEYKEGFVSYNTIKKILKKMGYKLHKIKKTKVYNKIEENDEIFENVNEVKESVKISDDSVAAISLDDKANKKIGEISDNGKTLLNLKALDHDTIINGSYKPFGILDIKTNETFVTCTASSSTAEFKVNCIEEYIKHKIKKYPFKKLYIFLDNGPENSGRRKLWLKLLTTKIVKKYKIVIELVYYPPYHSKYNMIERYWARLQMFWNKVIIKNEEQLKNVISQCSWKGIKTIAKIDKKEYHKGIKVSDYEMEELEEKYIIRDEELKNWSIVITPFV